MQSFKFELVSPERLLVSEDVESVVVPGSEGEMTVMAGHAPVMTSLRPGVIVAKATDGKVNRYVVFGGFADILPESLTLLAEASSHVDDFDRAELTRRVEDTRQAITKAENAEQRTQLEQFLDQLTTLDGIVMPA